MSCLITNGRTEQCKESVGGIQAVYFENFENASGVTFNVDGEISAIEGTATVYKYELKGANSWVETITTSRDNGTTYYSGVLTINLKKMSNEMTKQIKVLAAGRTRIWVHFNNGETILMGYKRGVDMTGGTIVSGTAMGDLYGYSGLTFTSMEKDPAYFLHGSTETNPFEGTFTDFVIITD